MDILYRVQSELPLVDSLKLGHTPVQIKFFKTAQQRGCRKFEYWQHLVQMKALKNSIAEARLEIESTQADIQVLNSFWSRLKTARVKRAVEEKKLRFRLNCQIDASKERELELLRHLEFVTAHYHDLLGLTEAEILEGEEDYWVLRLSRQLAFGKMAQEQGMSSGDIATVAALPEDLGKRILFETQKLLSSGEIWEARQLEGKHGE